MSTTTAASRTFIDFVAAALPAGAIDRTVPNSGLTVVFTTADGAAFRCLACGAGTGVGAYDPKRTRAAARMHRGDSCIHRGAHHITRTGMSSRSIPTILGRRRQPARDSITCPVAFCSCGWKAFGEDGNRESGRRLARRHRNETHSAWLDAHGASP